MPRFLRLLERAEQRAVVATAAAANAATAFGICWGGRGRRVDAAQLLPGEAIAVDVVIAMWSPRFREVYESERVTRDPDDLGWVLNPAGRRIGHITAIDGDLVTQALDADWLDHVPLELPPMLEYSPLVPAGESVDDVSLPASGD